MLYPPNLEENCLEKSSQSGVLLITLNHLIPRVTSFFFFSSSSTRANFNAYRRKCRRRSGGGGGEKSNVHMLTLRLEHGIHILTWSLGHGAIVTHSGLPTRPNEAMRTRASRIFEPQYQQVRAYSLSCLLLCEPGELQPSVVVINNMITKYLFTSICCDTFRQKNSRRKRRQHHH